MKGRHHISFPVFAFHLVSICSSTYTINTVNSWNHYIPRQFWSTVCHFRVCFLFPLFISLHPISYYFAHDVYVSETSQKLWCFFGFSCWVGWDVCLEVENFVGLYIFFVQGKFWWLEIEGAKDIFVAILSLQPFLDAFHTIFVCWTFWIRIILSLWPAFHSLEDSENEIIKLISSTCAIVFALHTGGTVIYCMIWLWFNEVVVFLSGAAASFHLNLVVISLISS